VSTEHIWKSFALEGLRLDRKQTPAATDPTDPKFPQMGAMPMMGMFSGYASTWAKDLEGDRIAPGAFAQSIADQKGKIPIFLNHDSDNWIGFSTALAEDHKGLMLNGALALNTSNGSDVYQLLLAAQEVDFRVGMSIGFVATDFEEDGTTRVLKTIELWETSITPFPANQRAYVDDVKTLRNMEKRLRDAGGFSSSDAKRIVALLARSMPSADADGSRPAPARDVREVRPTLNLREEIWRNLRP
jgi:HK97 family phage prohead protease